MEANTRVNRVAEAVTTIAGIGVVVLTAIVMIFTEIVRYFGIYVTYFLGDLISRTLMRVGYGYRLYSKLMQISSDLDKNDVLWKTPCKEHPEVEQANKHQRIK